MNKYALIGYPLGHSLSPFIHEKLFAESGSDNTYELMPLTKEELFESGEKLRRLAGFNVTIPHKAEIIPFCTKLDRTAEKCGAVNCVVNKGREIVGYNTDVLGFNRALKILGVNGMALGGKKTLLLGCGGAGRMMAAELAGKGACLTIAVRRESVKKTEKLLKDIKEQLFEPDITVVPMDTLTGGYEIIANSTPVGMFPETDAMPVSESVLEGAKYVFDAVYNPKETMLVKAARKAGAAAGGGLAMLVYQAAAAHEIWYGAKFSEDFLSKLIDETEKQI